ncbi:hypothetical protein TNCV_1934491 [Trichonephila clavipes]|nr:hypothetical protein TNCV_1934491 [Trichonephila clavipes]
MSCELESVCNRKLAIEAELVHVKPVESPSVHRGVVWKSEERVSDKVSSFSVDRDEKIRSTWLTVFELFHVSQFKLIFGAPR